MGWVSVVGLVPRSGLAGVGLWLFYGPEINWSDNLVRCLSLPYSILRRITGVHISAAGWVGVLGGYPSLICSILGGTMSILFLALGEAITECRLQLILTVGRINAVGDLKLSLVLQLAEASILYAFCLGPSSSNMWDSGKDIVTWVRSNLSLVFNMWADRSWYGESFDGNLISGDNSFRFDIPIALSGIILTVSSMEW